MREQVDQDVGSRINTLDQDINGRLEELKSFVNNEVSGILVLHARPPPWRMDIVVSAAS